MDNHRSDASILNLSDRLSNDDQKHCHIVQDTKILYLRSKLKQIINSTEMLWIYLLLFVLLIIVGYYVLLCFSILNIIGIGQLKQVEDTFTKDNPFTNKSKFNGYSLVTTGVDNRVFTSK
jgi:hypothetical protein